MSFQVPSELVEKIHDFVTTGFQPSFGKLKDKFRSEPIWQRLEGLGSRLWLDTGSIADAQAYWTGQFSALTTNNTLLNREIQTGQYDQLISRAAELLAEYPQLTPSQRMLEIAFILNAWHGLRLVEKFDAFVSVEEHTDLAHSLEHAVAYARRYYAICPQRFIIKIPFTPAGLLATRILARQGLPINHTLGFSARQNYLIARIGNPKYVNVFLGRLNSFIADNKLGSGDFVGEKATLASQQAIRRLNQAGQSTTRQIGASFRAGQQVIDLAGIDVMTMPPKVAGEVLELKPDPRQITDKTGMIYEPQVNDDVDRQAIRLDTLWQVSDDLKTSLDKLERENLDDFTAGDLVNFFHEHGVKDLLVNWSDTQIKTNAAEGKIPKLANWQRELAQQRIGLDSLINLAGLNSFAADQKAMDERVRQVLQR